MLIDVEMLKFGVELVFEGVIKLGVFDVLVYIIDSFVVGSGVVGFCVVVEFWCCDIDVIIIS